MLAQAKVTIKSEEKKNTESYVHALVKFFGFLFVFIIHKKKSNLKQIWANWMRVEINQRNFFFPLWAFFLLFFAIFFLLSSTKLIKASIRCKDIYFILSHNFFSVVPQKKKKRELYAKL